MRFVEQVKKATKSNSTIIITSEKFDDSDLNQDDVEQSLDESIPATKPSKHKKSSFDSTKEKLLRKCVDILDKPKETQFPPPKVDPFALYISSQLEGLD